MIRDLKETKICQMVSTGLYSEKGFDVPAALVDKIVDIAVSGVTQALNDLKSKENPVAFKFSKPNGDFICAAFVQFFPNEDKSKPGNWNYSWTFDEEDIKDIKNVRDSYDNSLIAYFRGTGVTKYGMRADQSEYYGDVFSYLFQCIKKWLDDNASEEEENGAKLDGVIQFRVAVEKGEKCFSIEPDGEIKQGIKSDIDIEV